MEFREISTFLQVAQHQSFSKAAKQLGYSQAAVTIQIKQLENELGVHLFDRIGKQISLTHQGQVFYQYAVAIQKDLAQARGAVSDASTLNGKLCLGTIESICASIFPDLLSEYHRLYPEVTISIVTDSPDVLLNRMNGASTTAAGARPWKSRRKISSWLLRIMSWPGQTGNWSWMKCCVFRFCSQKKMPATVIC